MQPRGRWDAGLGQPAGLVLGFPSRVPVTRLRFPFPRLQNMHWRLASSSHAVLDAADGAPFRCPSHPGRQSTAFHDGNVSVMLRVHPPITLTIVTPRLLAGAVTATGTYEARRKPPGVQVVDVADLILR